MITETSLYWVLKLDSIRHLFDCFACIFTIFSVILGIPLIIGAVLCNVSCDFSNDDEEAGVRRILMAGGLVEFVLVFIAISSAICHTLIPSTKEYAMIKVIPMVASSTEFKELKGDAKELYKLGIEATKSQLKSLTHIKDEPKNGK
jgi:hypothetical protein